MKTRVFLCLTSIVILAAGNVFGKYSGGTGESNNPYRIGTKTDLMALASNTVDYDKCFILISDIDVGGQSFTRAIIAEDSDVGVVYNGTAFIGTFDGNGHKVRNFLISGGNASYLGLFGYIGTGGSVKNLGLESCAVSGYNYVGGLAGYVIGCNIDNCYSTGNVYSSPAQCVGGLVGYMGNDGAIIGSISNCYTTGRVYGNTRVGGLVGKNYSSIHNCYSTGTVISGTTYVGGLVGQAGGNSTISQCFSTSGISGGTTYVGGLVGDNYGISINDCYSTGNVSGGSNSQYVGGLVGMNSSSIMDSYSTSKVSGSSGSQYIGGLTGYSYGAISNCYSTGEVSGSSDSRSVGGLVGECGGNSTIRQCCSISAVVGGSMYTGGLVGFSEGDISQSYSTGVVKGASDSFSSFVGGLAGANYGNSIENCYSISDVDGKERVGGLVGENYMSSIANSYSTGKVSGAVRYMGGLVGIGYFSVVNGSFWDTQTSGRTTSGGGTGKTTAQMKTLSTFTSAEWDFTNEIANGTNNYWRMCVTGVDYPWLNWESIAGDFTCPDGVNMEDLGYFVQRWLENDCASSNNCGGSDMDASGTVDMTDFALFASHWLECN